MTDLLEKKILIVDDDPTIRFLLQTILQDEGCVVEQAADGQEGLRKYYDFRPDLVVLDVNMPRVNGWEMLKSIRQLSDTPVMILTRQNVDEDIIKGLDCGADDYLAKPVNPKVFLARLRAALRRSAPARSGDQGSGYQDPYLSVDLENHRVLVNGQEVSLSAKEFGLLRYLVENAGRVLTARQILERVWGWEYQDSVDYIRVYITHLRQKLEQDIKNPRYLVTEHGTGYRFVKYQQ